MWENQSGKHKPRPLPNALYLDGPDQSIAVAALVVDKDLGSCRRQPEEDRGLTDVSGLSAGEHELQRIAQGVGESVDFGSETTRDRPTASAAAVFLAAAAHEWARTPVESINILLPIRLMCAPGVQNCPGAVATLPGETLEHRIPLAQLGRQFPPWPTDLNTHRAASRNVRHAASVAIRTRGWVASTGKSPSTRHR